MPVYLGSNPVADLPFQETVYNGAGEVCFERDIFGTQTPTSGDIITPPSVQGEFKRVNFRQRDLGTYQTSNTPDGYRIELVAGSGTASVALKQTPVNINNPMPCYVNVYVTDNDTGNDCYFDYGGKGGSVMVIPSGDPGAVQMGTYQFPAFPPFWSMFSVSCNVNTIGTGFTIVRIELIAGIAPEGTT